MKKIVFILALGVSLFANDIIVKESHCSVKQTVEHFKGIVKAKGLHVFAVINHSGNARVVNMKLNESKMIVFGNAKLGTALMQQDMTTGLDLPLRVLVFRDTDGKVKMAYRDGSWLANHHLLNAKKKIAKMNNAMDKITTKAGQCKRD
ncbi:DUF302 domain-containing protein [Sulfurimonas paralvinellae]|uniref:DUF302 domain-containing protein n=1 Tax=Sulfurimonas paralvinellae TaxID=317658 RepID=A0A7M1B5P6_9BACT|nr:DUF302 domain-containing protein [Sulfurimonas paralvinellae]